jgi:cytochrome b561
MPGHPERYDGVSIFLHWSIGIGIFLVGLAEMLRGELLAKGSAAREALKAIHEPAGLVILALVLVSVGWRLVRRVPDMPRSKRPWEAAAARLMHRTLFGLMIVVPLLGLATTAARGRPIDLGWFQISFGGPASRDTARLLKGLHELASQLLLALGFLHAAAATWHHYARADHVLTRMLPVPLRTDAAGPPRNV